MTCPDSTAAGVSYLALAVALGACDPAPSGDVDALVADLTEDGHRPVVRTLTTLSDGAALSGDAARIRGGGEVALAVPFDTPSELGAYRDAMIAEPGEVVRPRWTTVDGALYPRDFDAFALTTLYHHVEQAVLYFEALGASLPEPLDVHYLGRLAIPGTDPEIELTDNALYFFGVRFMVVTRFELLQDVPLGMNRGVVVHEVGHAIFDALVYDDEARLRLLDGNLADRSANLLRSITEGLSDYFAAAQTGDPQFLDESVPPELLAYPRDVDQSVVYTDGIRDSADAVPAVYDPYVGGTCLAAALWQLPVDKDVLGAALVEAQRALGERLREEPPWDEVPPDLGFAWLLDEVVRQLDEPARAGVCDVFVARLPAATLYMTECP